MTDEKTDNRIDELLEYWEDQYDLGNDISASEICVNCPDLAEEIQKKIDDLRATRWMLVQPGNEKEFVEPEEFGIPERLGRYRLHSLIGSGGFAQVWKAFDPDLEREVAIKIPRTEQLSSTDKFLEEARRVAKFRHPNIVPVYDVGKQGNLVYIVSELIGGFNLATEIGRVSVEQAESWIKQIAEALAVAHDHGFVHLDVKPSNVILNQSKTQAFLTDFGISQSYEEINSSSRYIGTTSFMAPEQVRGDKVDPRTDIYALGVVLHQLVTGNLPYHSKKSAEIREEILHGRYSIDGLPRTLRPIVQRCLSMEPMSRYASAQQLANDLNASMKPKKIRTGRFLTFGMSACLLFSAGVYGASKFFAEPQRDPKPPANAKIGVYEGHTDSVNSIVVSGNNKFITGSDDSTIRLWMLGSPDSQSFDLLGPVRTMALSRDRASLAIACDGELALFNPSKNQLESLGTGDPIVSLSFDQKSYLLLVGRKTKVELWNLLSEKPRPTNFPNINGELVNAVFLKDDHIAIGIRGDQSGTSKVWFWRLNGGQLHHLGTGKLPDGVSALAFSADSNHMLAAIGQEVQVWDRQGPKSELKHLGAFRQHESDIKFLAVSPRGKLVASCDGKSVRVWDAETKRVLQTIKVGAMCVRFIDDGQKLLIGKDDGTVVVEVVRRSDGF